MHSFTLRYIHSAIHLRTRLLTHIPLYLDTQHATKLDQTNNKICHLGDHRTVSLETKYKYVVLIPISTRTYISEYAHILS